jgi:asparagine synthase (glutamine-hydrolysing)
VCGIVGKVSVSGRVPAELIETMCCAVEHRGPDSRGTYMNDGIGLGIQRLRVIDLATGDQPIFNEDRSVVVVLNGEIYNYKELREQLRSRGHVFSTDGDTEVIAHLYEDHGKDCVQVLRGMFAFAVWDIRERRLLLARDRVGKKPLVYAVQGGTLWFASEIRALLADPTINREINLEAIDSFLQLQYVPAPVTAFAGIEKLQPAHTLVWHDGEISVERYWRLSYATPERLPTREEAHEEIRQRLLRATELRLRSDVPVGAFLSGGIDSSAVVAAMAMRSSTPVKTFSIGFDVDEFDERDHAREVSRLYGTDHHELVVVPQALEVLPKLVWHFGEPFADNSAIPTFYLSQLAREHVTVALNGDGGDENFGGYGRYATTRLADKLAATPRPVQLAAQKLSGLLRANGQVSSYRFRFRRETQLALLDEADRYAWRMAHVKPEETSELYTADFQRAVHGSVATSVIRDPFEASDATDDVNRRIDTDVQTYLPNALLVKMDITSMAHSLEMRSPLLDHKLMEYVARLPGSWKVDGEATKQIFKDAVRPWLPATILDRPKWGFGSPLSHWFRGELKNLPAEVLLDRRSVERGWFRESAVRTLIEDHASGQRDNTNRLWALIQLELWLQTFVDARPRAPLVLDTAAL